MIGRSFVGCVVLSLALGWAVADAAPEKPVLMVIYFDNLTGKPEQDVLKKGLADMIITDLVAYDGVTVVERDKHRARRRVLGQRGRHPQLSRQGPQAV